MSFSVRKVLPLLVISALLFACNKDEDDEPPVIRLSAPTENTVHDALSAIDVRAEITDNEKIVSVSVWLANSDLTPVDRTVGFKPNAKTYSLNTSYELENIQLESGQHYLVVRAQDENGESKDQVSIIINEVPREQRGLVFIGLPNGSVANEEVFKIDAGFQQIEQVKRLASGTTAGSTVSSYYQQMVVGFEDNRGVQAFDLGSFEVNWSRSEPMQIKHLSLHNETTYVTGKEQEVLAYDHAGAQIFTVFREDNDFYRSLNLLPHADRVFAVEESIGSGKPRFAAYFTTGFLEEWKEIDIEIERMFPYDEERLLLFANGSGGNSGRIYQFTIDGFGFWEASQSLSSGRIRDVAQVSAEQYVIAHDNGMYLYNAATNSVVLVLNGIIANQVLYDPINNEVMMLRTVNDRIEAYAYSISGLTLLRSFEAGFPVREMHLWYNR